MSTELISETRSGLRIWLAVIGVVSIVVGALILAQPRGTGAGAAVVATVVLGMYAVIAGIAYAFSGVFTSGITGWSRLWRIIAGILTLLAGILIVLNTSTSSVVFIWFVAIMIGLTWITEGVLTFVNLGQAMSKGWAIVFAVVSIAAGIAVLLAPVTSAVVLWWLVGLSAVVWGVLELVVVFMARR